MDGRDEEDPEKSDDRGVIIPPLGLPDVQSRVDLPQHLSGTETGASPPQHLSAPNAGSSPTAPQHLTAPNAGSSPTAPQHLTGPDVSSPSAAPQHAPTTEVSNAPQHLQSSSAPQHLTGAEHGAEATNPGNAGLQGPKPSNTGFHRLRHLSKIQIAVAAATTAALVAAGAIIVSAQHDDPQTEAPPATTVAVTIVETAITVETQAPPTPRTTPPTAAPTTTEAATTTTVAALPSGAGTYSVSASATHLVSDVITQDLPSDANNDWVLVGPCDGVGDCTVTVLSTGDADAGFFTGAERDASGNLVFPLSPTGDGGYANNFTVDSGDGCSGAGTLTATGVAQGQITAAYRVAFAAAGECPAFTIATDFTATRDG